MHLMIVVAAVLFVCGSARDLEPERDGRLELVAGRTGGDGEGRARRRSRARSAWRSTTEVRSILWRCSGIGYERSAAMARSRR